MTALTLKRLTRREVNAMIDRLAGNKPLPTNIRQDIIKRTDGIPLFVEEMTKALLEAESLSAAAEAIAMVPRPALAVPASLHASLMARLDRLGAPAKEVAQISAAIGREFTQALLAAVVQKPEADLNTALDRLVQSGLLFRQGVPPHASYLFKHALVQDAAYGTLLREPRRALHGRIAETLEIGFPDIAENPARILARHCTEAGFIEEAAGLWGKAGQRSLERSALVEAVAQFKSRPRPDRGLAHHTCAAPRANQVSGRAYQCLDAHRKAMRRPRPGRRSDQSRALIERAEAMGEPPEDPLLLFSILYGFWIANVAAFNRVEMRELAAQFLALAERQGAAIPLLIGHDIMG